MTNVGDENGEREDTRRDRRYRCDTNFDGFFSHASFSLSPREHPVVPPFHILLLLLHSLFLLLLHPLFLLLFPKRTKRPKKAHLCGTQVDRADAMDERCVLNEKRNVEASGAELYHFLLPTFASSIPPYIVIHCLSPSVPPQCAATEKQEGIDKARHHH